MSDSERDPAIDVVVCRRRAMADGVVAIDLRSADGKPLPSWSPGAHIDIDMPGDLCRQYSLCGDPAADCYTVAVLREHHDGGSAWLHDHATDGTCLSIRGPRNHFALLPSSAYIFIAGGIGITPLVPMIAQAESTGSEWSLHYGGRQLGSMSFLSVAEKFPHQTNVVPQDTAGLLDLQSILGASRPDTLVYCCGPESLIAATEAVMKDWPQQALHVERFAPRPAAVQQERSFAVICADSGITVDIAASCSVLDALMAAGIDVPSSCSEGTCGTCETDVVAGEPDHRDSVLSEGERASNATMMLCVSRSLSDTLTLDI